MRGSYRQKVWWDKKIEDGKKLGEGTWWDEGELVSKAFYWQETNTTFFLTSIYVTTLTLQRVNLMYGWMIYSHYAIKNEHNQKFSGVNFTFVKYQAMHVFFQI